MANGKMTSENGNSVFVKWALIVAASLATAGILGNLAVSRTVAENTINIRRNLEQIRDLNESLRDIKVEMNRRFDRLGETQLEILRAIRK